MVRAASTEDIREVALNDSVGNDVDTEASAAARKAYYAATETQDSATVPEGSRPRSVPSPSPAIVLEQHIGSIECSN